ncbi:unnamed protein product [Spirodela intermedia]|uniref:Uncharacterized protein n=1 Tax=Spirodela intermedia TaxID=51605 RepID=A0A7I8IYU8_SPIIN|nr:unnamed protein product [Spirodela intermedia]CAA6662892.1 unnamed protein product [Spirodela intermedia]
MRKRERENPCGVCGHYHNHEEGRFRTAVHPVSSAFPSEILKDFLYLGSYDNACRGELLRTQGISRILNTVPACQNLYKNSFTYYCLQDDKVLPFNDAIQFLEQCERDKARVLVHCMSGRSRSPAIVIAYLMKSRGWRLAQSLNWVKERRPSVDLFPGTRKRSTLFYQQLVDFEAELFDPAQSFSSMGSAPAFGLGIPKPVHPAAATTAAPPLPPPLLLLHHRRSSRRHRRPSLAVGLPQTAPGGVCLPGRADEPAEVNAPSTFGVTATGAEAPMDSC